MARIQTMEPSKGLLRRILTSKVLLMFIFLVVVVGVMIWSTIGVSRQVQTDRAQFLSDAVRRSAVQCYALEGRFPDTVDYLEEHYGLIIDRSHYAVYYENMGGNILPQIRVVVIGSGR